jgi:hypothetical protein
MGIISVKKLALQLGVDNFKILEALKHLCTAAKKIKGFSDKDAVLHMNFEDDGQAFIDYWVDKGYDSDTYHNEPIPPMVQDKIGQFITGQYFKTFNDEMASDEVGLKTSHVKLARQQQKEDDSKKDKLRSSQDDNQKDGEIKDEQIEDITDPQKKTEEPTADQKSIDTEIAKLEAEY